MPEETAAVLHDGWLRTGDLVCDNGDETYTFVGRVKDVIRRRGENLSPAEVEAALERHPTVAEAAVIAVASELSEDDVKAFVVAAPGASIDTAEVRAFAAGQLAAFKVPRYVEVVDELPHGPTGRLTKHVLPTEQTDAEVDFAASPGQAAVMDRPADAPGDDAPWLTTWIGSSGADHIRVAGRDLPSEVMGRLTLTDLSYLLVSRREPTDAQRRLVDAVLVSLADHGLTPSALATRLTYTGAPESLQGAVAAGLLGAGSVFLGPTGDTAQLLADALERSGTADPDDATLRAIATELVETARAAGARVPGLGHPVHKGGDPRTPRIYELAEHEGLLGPHLRLLALIAEMHAERTGKALPVNGAGAGGAALLDAGVPANAVRGMALIARTAGLVAHLVEEADAPIGMPLWLEVEARAGDEGRGGGR
jgi:citrate synthase